MTSGALIANVDMVAILIASTSVRADIQHACEWRVRCVIDERARVQVGNELQERNRERERSLVLGDGCRTLFASVVDRRRRSQIV